MLLLATDQTQPEIKEQENQLILRTDSSAAALGQQLGGKRWTEYLNWQIFSILIVLVFLLSPPFHY